MRNGRRTVEKRTKGRVQFELTSLPELGFGGARRFASCETGVVDVAETYGGNVAGELPMVEILEMPGIFPDPQTAKKAILAWKPTEAKILDQKANAVSLAMAVDPTRRSSARRPVRKLADFKGLKTRVHSVALASLVAGLGGEPLTIAFAEVYTALERGTLDAGISGTKPGFGLRWYEVTKYLGRAHLDAAARRPGRQQERLGAACPPTCSRSSRKKRRRSSRARRSRRSRPGTRKGSTAAWRRAWSTFPSRPRLRPPSRTSLRSQVVPDWVKRAGGAEAAKLFNEVIAPLVGFTVGS